MTITRHKVSYFSGRSRQNDNTFMSKNQNNNRTVGLNNSAARAQVMPRSMQRLIVLGKWTHGDSLSFLVSAAGSSKDFLARPA